ncbi:MAG: tRNA-dihydrouridine synthase, partial [Anaerolineae bacterium]|nr:tRNA-dihydrouridine synthase [Anaerolineae bacterium]
DDGLIIEAARKVESLGAAAIDINLGCATPKVAGSGAGASMLGDVGAIARLFAGLTRALSMPVSGKIRLGLDEDSRNYLEVARAIAGNGAALIAVHGRTAAQAYRGSADWAAIAEVKQAVDIPVLASGDVKEPSDVDRILEATGCDGVMIGRAAIGNPWIFQGLGRGALPWASRVPLVLEHLQMMVDFHGVHHGVRRFRKHLREYLVSSGISRRNRAVLLACDDADRLRELLTGAGDL